MNYQTTNDMHIFDVLKSVEFTNWKSPLKKATTEMHWENLSFPIIYIMSKGEARHSQSETSFNIKRKARDKIIPRSNIREEIADTSPTILVNQASISTIAEELITVNTNFTSPRASNNNQNPDKLPLKLNQLEDKSGRYVPQKEFLTRCTVNKLIPKGLELSLEPTIGIDNQGFINNLHSNLKDFSFILMKDIVK